MNVSFQEVELAGLQDLLPLVKEFYDEHPLEFNQEKVMAGLELLLTDSNLGVAWLIYADSDIAGYMILTFGFSLEFAGRDAFIDEIYIRPEFRGKGLGSRAMTYAQEYALKSNIKAIHLEVEKSKGQAIALYEKMGFQNREGNYLMSWSH